MKFAKIRKEESYRDPCSINCGIADYRFGKHDRKRIMIYRRDFHTAKAQITVETENMFTTFSFHKLNASYI